MITSTKPGPSALKKQAIKIEMLERSLRQDFDLSLSKIAPHGSGDWSTVYSAMCDGEQVFVKIGDDPKRSQVEVAALELFGHHDIPAPRTLGFVENASLVNRPIMIQTAAVGKAIS